MNQIGKVYLVGAGPGDAKLITVKAMEVIAEADVILYDRLVNAELLGFARPDCELIYCGKLPNRHVLRQEIINDTLIGKALSGNIVVRLKGGDPGVFGRVGEEAGVLADRQIPFEMVPGITSGIAAPLYAGIPVTHREYGKSFAVVTAHDRSEDGKPSICWEGLARGVDTIAFYMGVANLSYICESLIEYGKSPDTPVILIQWGTLNRQKTLEGTLATIAERSEAAHFNNPAITLIGSIVKLRHRLQWFEQKPLFGHKILIAGSSGLESGQVSGLLAQEGADIVEFPKWSRKSEPLNLTVVKRAAAYDQIVFTTSAAVDDFFSAIAELGLDIRSIRADFAAVSPAALPMMRERGIVGTLLQDALPEETRVLLIGDEEDLQPDTAAVFRHLNDDDIDTWVTARRELNKEWTAAVLRGVEETGLSTVIFTGRKAVEQFAAKLPEFGLDPDSLLRQNHLIGLDNAGYDALHALGMDHAVLFTGEPHELVSLLAENGENAQWY